MADAFEGVDAFRRRESTLPKGDLREQALLDSLERLLRDRSIADISVDMISSGAGVKRPAFYAYFETKHAALAVALARVRKPLAAGTEGVVTASSLRPLSADDIADAIRSLVEMWRDHADLLQAVIEAAAQEPELDSIWTSWIEGFTDSVVSVIPTMPGADSVARALLWANERYLYQTFRTSRSDEAVVMVAAALTTIWTAMLSAADGVV